MREIFLDDERASILVDETGFRKSLTLLTLEDREELIVILCQHYTLIRGRMELDQFVEGLRTHKVLDMVRAEPLLMKPLFVSTAKKLTKR